MGGQVLNFAFAGVGLGFATPIAQRAIGGFLPFGQYNQPVITAGTGYLLSWLFDVIPFTRRLSQPALVLGLSTAVIQIIQPFVRGALGGGAAANPTMSGWGRGRGMRGIAAVPNTLPPGLALPGPAVHPAAAATSGMQGIAAYPTPGSFRRR